METMTGYEQGRKIQSICCRHSDYPIVYCRIFTPIFHILPQFEAVKKSIGCVNEKKYELYKRFHASAEPASFYKFLNGNYYKPSVSVLYY